MKTRFLIIILSISSFSISCEKQEEFNGPLIAGETYEIFGLYKTYNKPIVADLTYHKVVSIDVNGDGVNDISFSSEIDRSSGGINGGSLIIRPTNDYTYIKFISQQDSIISYTTGGYTTTENYDYKKNYPSQNSLSVKQNDYFKSYRLGEEIALNNNYTNNAVLIYKYNYSQTNTSENIIFFSNWKNKRSNYLVIKTELESETYYSWIKLDNIPSKGISIIDSYTLVL
jgi:hypothetical protein